jgi:hypothetical protein
MFGSRKLFNHTNDFSEYKCLETTVENNEGKSGEL